MTHIALAVAWGLVILASWIGWGRLIARWVVGSPASRVDVGLSAGWGMTLMLLLGGVLNAAGKCGPGIIITIVLLGFVCFGIDLLIAKRDPSPLEAESRRDRWGYLPLVVLLAVVYTASVCWKSNWNEADDFLAYTLFPVEMLQRGSAIDPFSWRRLSTLGGYAFLQTPLAAVAWPQTAFQLDIGLGSLLSTLLLVPPLRRRSAPPWLAALPAMLCVLMPLGRINSMCSQLAVAGFLLLVRTMELETVHPPRRRARLWFLIGAVSTGIVTLRPNFLPVVGVAVMLNVALDVWSRKRSVGGAAASLAITGAGALLCLLPWSLSLYHAGNTYFYPLMHGNDHGGAALLVSSMPLPRLLRFILGFFLRPKMLVVVLAGLAAAVTLQKQVLSLWAAAVIGAALTVWKLNLGDYGNLTRYALPALVAAAVAAVASLPLERRSRSGRVLAGAMAGIVGLLVVYNCVNPVGIVRDSVESLAHLSSPLYPPQRPAEYVAAQAAVPRGKTVLAFVNYPFLFDQRRNVVYSADEAGIASPGAGYPFTAGATTVAAYLRDNHIDYLITDDFGRPGIVNRDLWTALLGSDNLISHRTAEYLLRSMNCFDALAKNAPNVVRSGPLRVIPLK